MLSNEQLLCGSFLMIWFKRIEKIKRTEWFQMCLKIAIQNSTTECSNKYKKTASFWNNFDPKYCIYPHLKYKCNFWICVFTHGSDFYFLICLSILEFNQKDAFIKAGIFSGETATSVCDITTTKTVLQTTLFFFPSDIISHHCKHDRTAE